MRRRTRPPLGLPARIEVGYGTRSAVQAALRAYEAKATISIGRGWRVSFIVIARDRSRVSGWVTKIEIAYMATTSPSPLFRTPGSL